MLIEFGIEIEARGNAEALQRGPENRDVGFGCADDDPDLAERPPGRGLLENAARDLFGFALDAGGFHQRQGGKSARTRWRARWRSPYFRGAREARQ